MSLSLTLALILKDAQTRSAVSKAALAAGRSWRQYPTEALPTVAFDGTVTPGGVTYAGWSSGAPNPVFGITGVDARNLAARATAYPGSQIVTGARGVANTLGTPRLRIAFWHTGQWLDLRQFGSADDVDIWVDGAHAGHYDSISPASGTAQAGGASTVTLPAAASSTNGFYVAYYVTIISGTGAGQTRQIAGYVGSTKVATVDAAWSTAPDNTSVLRVTGPNNGGVSIAADDGSVGYLHLTWAKRAKRLIVVDQSSWMGVVAGPNDSITPAAPVSPIRILVVGDSFPEGSSAPHIGPPLATQLADTLGMELINLASGGTGWATPLTKADANRRLNIRDRVAPPAEAWNFPQSQLTAGTFTLSLTYNGVTQTTTALAYNAGGAVVENALNELPLVAAAGADIAVARGDFLTPRIIVAHGLPGATLSVDLSSATGSAPITQWKGDVHNNVPRDVDGNDLPFVLLVVGSGNDAARSDAQVQAASEHMGQQIAARFPTALPIFVGAVAGAEAGLSGTIGASDISRNAAYAAGAAYLPRINGRVPFIDTYSAGLGGKMWLNGAGTIAAPVSGTTAYYKSIANPGHPTGEGAGYLADLLVAEVGNLLLS